MYKPDFSEFSEKEIILNQLYQKIPCRSFIYVGTCWEFRPEEAMKAMRDRENQTDDHEESIGHDQLRSLSLLVGHNESDSTYGWNDARDSLTVYYTLLPLEHSHQHQRDHSHTLVPILSTEVQIKLETTLYKNKPYTACNDVPYYTQRTWQITLMF